MDNNVETSSPHTGDSSNRLEEQTAPTLPADSADSATGAVKGFARFLAIGARRVLTGQTRGQQAIRGSEASAVAATNTDATPATTQHRVGASDSGDETAANVGGICEQTARSNGGEESPKTPAQQAPSENTELQGRLDL